MSDTRSCAKIQPVASSSIDGAERNAKENRCSREFGRVSRWATRQALPPVRTAQAAVLLAIRVSCVKHVVNFTTTTNTHHLPYSVSTTAATRRSSWIVSAWWDLSYIVVTPLLIVPVVLIAARRWLTAEELSLVVIAFASLGHHLPGFMRAYGDSALFSRYRTRFLLVPVLVLGLALLFSPPSGLASALRLPWTHLHGLELILLIWGTWHGLMQTYGFMRIYDVRLGVNDRWTARLDHWLCLIVFVAGVVFSDARAFGVAEAMWQSGLPLFGPEVLKWTRLVVGSVGVCVLLAYLFNQLRLRNRGVPLSGIKLLLIGTTGWFYWYTGRLSTNVLIGLAMFEIYHAVQYYAIVWIYNRRLFARAGEKFGPLGFLFSDRWSMLGIYLAAIAAYSSIRYFTVDANAYVFRGGSQDAHQWLVALFVTSSFLHFYFDGFIWKVSEKKTQQNLVDEVVNTSIAERYVPGFLHAGKWAILLAIACGLLLAERYQAVKYGARREVARLQALMALTPDLPESQSLRSRQALARGNARAAIEHAQQALQLRPNSHTIHADLGLAYLKAGKLGQAEAALREALHLAPDQWEYHCDLGLLLAKQGDSEQAEQALRQAVALCPDLEQPREHLAEFYLRQGMEAEAADQFTEIAKRFPKSLSGELGKVLLLSRQGKHEEATELASFLAIGKPRNWRVQLALGSAMNASGNGELALQALQEARKLRRRSPEVHYQIGLAEFQRGKPARAIRPLQQATRLAPEHFAAHFQLANTYYTLGKFDQALDAFARCQEIQPQNPDLCANLGGLLAQIGRIETAENVYRSGLAAHPKSTQLSFNLGVLLWQLGDYAEARKLLLQAESLGMELPAEVRAAITENSNSASTSGEE